MTINLLFSFIMSNQFLNLIFHLIGPTIIWFFICLWWDRKQPEPNRQIIRTFLLGGLVALLLTFINIPLTEYIKKVFFGPEILLILILSFLVDALIEEGGKLTCFKFTVYRFPSFDEPVDGMIYGIILGLGFAFTENIFYAFAIKDISLAADILLLRGFTTTFMHFIAGGIIGYYFALSKFSLRKKFPALFKGFILAVLFHGFYNTLSRLNQPLILYFIAILLIIIFIFMFRNILRLRKIEVDLLTLMDNQTG